MNMLSLQYKGEFIIFLITFHFCICLIEGSNKVQCNLTKVWGPGLDPQNVVLPARYFFIEAYDEDGNRCTESPGKEVYSANIFDPSQSCRIRSEVLDRQDGSFIVRYKVYDTCSKLIVSVRCHGSELPGFPYNFQNVFHAECSCDLNEDIDDWYRRYGCRNHYHQIVDDLRVFKLIDFDKIFPAAKKTLFNNVHRYSVCNYIIKENQIFRKCYGQYTGFKMFVDAILLFLSRRVRIPDIEILINLGDWPLIMDKIDLDGERILIPMFSWCGSDNSWDIVLPTYDITESSLESLGRVSLDMLFLQGNTGPRWEEKFSQLFWRGRDSSRERLKLIEISRQNKHLINASLTDFFFFRDQESLYGPKEKRVGFHEFFKFKYQMNMDGTVAAYRFPYLLAGDSLVFKQDSEYFEFFYKELKKWQHYIPVKRDLTDLVDKLEWAIKNDEKSRKISLEGQNYARKNLLPHDIFCYHVKLFHEYSKRQITKEIKIRPDMELVSANDKSSCDCETFLNKKSEPTQHEEL